MRLALSVLTFSIASLAPAGAVFAQEVVLRHNLQGAALDQLATLTLKFNDQQKANKGAAKPHVVLQAAAALSDEDKAKTPHMALLDLDDVQDYFAKPPKFMPLFQVFKDTGEKFGSADFYPQITDAVADSAGRMQGLPVGMAFPALFRNKDTMLKAGLDPEAPPKTMQEMQDMLIKLQAAGSKCPATSALFARLHAENVATQHGQQIATKGGKVELNTLINVKHIAQLITWQKAWLFKYYGPRREAEAHFLSGECAMITTDTALFSKLSPTEGVHAGASDLPYHDDTYNMTPTRVLPDGASLWVLTGKKKDEYKVVARYAKFLAQPEEQRDWVKATAYLPMTRSGMAALKEAGAFSPKLLQSAEDRLSVDSKKDNSGRVRDEEDRARLHRILDEEVEFAWNNTKPAKLLLDDAMQRANVGTSGASKSKR